MLIKIIYAIMFIGLGFAIIKYRRTVKGWTGNFFWAEKYLGNGGTHLVILLIGLGFMFFGTIYPFGGLDLLTGK